MPGMVQEHRYGLDADAAVRPSALLGNVDQAWRAEPVNCRTIEETL
jgi:hypothetical protein